GAIQLVGFGRRSFGRRASNTSHRRAQHGAQPHAETAEVDAPPEHAQRYADRVAVRHGGAEDAPSGPEHNPAERKTDDPVESSRKGTRIRTSQPNLRVDSSLPVRTPSGRGRTTYVAEVSQGRCSGHEILLCGHPGRCSEELELAEEGGHADVEYVFGVARLESP